MWSPSGHGIGYAKDTAWRSLDLATSGNSKTTKEYEHTNVTNNTGRAAGADPHSRTPGVFSARYTAHTRGGAAEAGSAAEAGLGASSTGSASCQQWSCGDYRAG